MSRIAYLDTVESPAGPLRFAVNAAGALLFTSFLEGRYRSTIEQDLRREGYALAADPAATEPARTQLAEYAAGARQTFELPLELVGSEWQQAVWMALLTIPFGETCSYGDIAKQLAQPWAARAVGRANGSNRIPLVIPCHRVIGADGTLTGFGGGLHLKTRLLDHEARVLGKVVEAPAEQLALAI
jgi:methylated-DNA-[protein]-cysteine S-methyltransferase